VAWSIEATQEFAEWFAGLTASEQISVAAKVDVLEQLGPSLGRPHVDTLKGSKYPNMKELRVQHGGKPYRIMFAFDPRQTRDSINWWPQRQCELVSENNSLG
jgi:hypothetical protein